jgi:hypothetical protein
VRWWAPWWACRLRWSRRHDHAGPGVLQRVFRSYADQGLAACAIEASSIGIVEHRLDGSKIRVALFTNFTQDHLDYHGSMDAYWQAKAQLFDWPGCRRLWSISMTHTAPGSGPGCRAVRCLERFHSRTCATAGQGHRTGRRRPELYRAGSRSQPAHEYASGRPVQRLQSAGGGPPCAAWA